MVSEHAQVLFRYKETEDVDHSRREIQVSVANYGAPDDLVADLVETRDLMGATETPINPGSVAANFVFIGKYRGLLKTYHPKIAYRDEVPPKFFEPEYWAEDLRKPRWLDSYRLYEVGYTRPFDRWFYELRIPVGRTGPDPPAYRRRLEEWELAFRKIRDQERFDPWSLDWDWEGSLDTALEVARS